ncbi:MAG: RNA-binding S4 domain-containing protein [Tannerellaceae bacterium]|jgi:ribosome-associated heat shock protein Hsp15|nr:RNA-binding S4 domain-containing protein [Tannerellaceae bacterium]
MAVSEVRIDKWMWATRVFKTRTIAAEACKKGRITIGGATMKPSRMIKLGDVIQVRKPPVTYSFKVVGLVENRIAAKLVADYLENVTPPEEYAVLEMGRLSGFVDRAKGMGRPTKKERRELEAFIGESDFDFDFDFGSDESTVLPPLDYRKDK